MDIATIIGIVSGFGLISIAIILGGSPAIFINVPSLVIVIGGTLAATLINYPLTDVLSIFGPIRKAFFHKESDPRELIDSLIQFATVARREGILALESKASETEDEFLSKSIQLAIDGTSPGSGLQAPSRHSQHNAAKNCRRRFWRPANCCHRNNLSARPRRSPASYGMNITTTIWKCRVAPCAIITVCSTAASTLTASPSEPTRSPV